jgi:nanoRNase/pAp phosphatase (c-di-AMP/oligoRNAs hydrolase)
LGESREAVYLFKGREAAADGLANWLGDELPEDEPVALIVVDLPAGARILDTTADYELIVADHIPPENLTVMEFNW